MRRINCYIPIKVCVSGPLTDTQLDQLGETIVRTVSARLAFAERTVMTALGSRSTPPAAADHARWMPAAYDLKAQRYMVPSYEGARGQASLKVKEAGQPATPDSARKSDEELEREVRRLQQWLSENAKTNDPDTEKMVQQLNALEAEARRHHAQPPAVTTQNPLLPKVTGNDQQDLVNVMAVVDSVRPSPVASGLYTTMIEGRTVELTQGQFDQLRGTAQRALKESLRKAKRKAEDAHDRYVAQSDVDKQHWIVAPIIKTLGRVKDPGPFLLAWVSAASENAAAAEAALEKGNFAEAARFLAQSETAAVKASKMWEAYFEGIIGAGEMTVTVLEYTRDASFITLGILATIATAGAAAGAVGATTTVAGIEVGTATAANVIATGAPIAATLGTAGIQVALGDKIHWDKVALDLAISLVLAKFGGKLADGIFRALAGNPGVQAVGRVAFGRIASSVLTGSASRAFTTTVETVYRSLKGQEVSWDKFTDELVERLTDPKALIIDAVMGAVTFGAQVKYAGGPKPPSGLAPEKEPLAGAAPSAQPAQVPGRVSEAAAASPTQEIGGEAYEPTAHPLAGTVSARRPRGFEPTVQPPGRRVRSGTLEGLEPTAHPAARSPRQRGLTREQQLEGLTPEQLGARGQAAAAGAKFKSLRGTYADKLGVGEGGQVHHAIELQTLDKYPGVFTEAELNSFSNMRGIPAEEEGAMQLHQSKIREVLDRHYEKLDTDITAQGLKPGTPEYNSYVRRYLTSARDEVDYILGQFFAEYRTGRPRSLQ